MPHEGNEQMDGTSKSRRGAGKTERMIRQSKRIPTKRARPRRKRPWLTMRNRQYRNEWLPFFDSRSYITKGGRYRLFGQDMTNLRVGVFDRSRGICEATQHHPDCPINVGWTLGQLAHRNHGAKKTDTLDGTEWRSAPCHLILQHAGGNGKPCPKKENVA
jgi:hypothetical protein